MLHCVRRPPLSSATTPSIPAKYPRTALPIACLNLKRSALSVHLLESTTNSCQSRANRGKKKIRRPITTYRSLLYCQAWLTARHHQEVALASIRNRWARRASKARGLASASISFACPPFTLCLYSGLYESAVGAALAKDCLCKPLLHCSGC